MPPFRTTLWRAYFGCVVFVHALFFSTVGLVIIALTRSPDRGHRWCAPRFGRSVLRALRIPMHVTGREHLQPDTTYLVAVTHTSDYHFYAMCAVAPMQWRGVATIGMQKIPLAGRVGKRTGHVFLNRWDPAQSAQALDDAVAILRSGCHLVYYPEGRRPPGGGLGRFRRGGFRVALRAGAPVVPLVLMDARKEPHLGKVSRHPGWITATFLPPILPEPGDDEGSFRDRVGALVAEALGQGHATEP